MNEERLAGGGETAVPPIGALDQQGTDAILELPARVAQRGLSDEQSLFGATEVRILGDSGKVTSVRLDQDLSALYAPAN